VGLANIRNMFRRSDEPEPRNGNSNPTAADEDLAQCFLDHVLAAWDLLVDARQRREAQHDDAPEGKVETEPDNKKN
jgi:hypothetical protein